MARPTCPVIKLLKTPESVKVRIVSCNRRKAGRCYRVVVRDKSIIGWKTIFESAECSIALDVLERELEIQFKEKGGSF